MKSLTILVIFSLVMVTLVAVSIIPQLIIPENDDSSSIFSRKKSAPSATSTSDNIDSDRAILPADNTIQPSKKDCDLADYSMDCMIVQYLEKNLASPSFAGKILCAYDAIGKSDGGDIVYLNLSCQEFTLVDGVVRLASGTSGPAKLIFSDNGSITHWVPRDGSDFYRDLNEFFPVEYREAALNPKSEKLLQINRERARKYFAADFNYKIEKAAGTSCSHDFECRTPEEYLLQSSCPFTSMCLNSKCAVICPDYLK